MYHLFCNTLVSKLIQECQANVVGLYQCEREHFWLKMENASRHLNGYNFCSYDPCFKSKVWVSNKTQLKPSKVDIYFPQ